MFFKKNNILTIAQVGNITIERVDYCNLLLEPLVNNVENNNGDYIFTMPSEGTYKVNVTTNGGQQSNFLIHHYPKLLKSIINEIEKVLCGCECDNCVDCKGDNKEMLDTLTKIMLYSYRVNYNLSSILEKFRECFDCALNESIDCILLNEKVYGNSDNTIALKRLISLFYLAFYKLEMLFTTEENKDDLKALFKFNKISKCINRIGVNLECITKSIESGHILHPYAINNGPT